MEKFRVHSKVWIGDGQGEVVFGFGRLKILEIVQKTGSIQAAAKELNMSYRAVWGKIKATEERLGAPLLVRCIGGTCGGGSQLTEFALALISSYRQLDAAVEAVAGALFDKDLALVLEQAQGPGEGVPAPER